MPGPWYKGKTVNPEFKDAARKHALECPTCGQAPFTSARDHQEWRNVAEGHVGAKLPETFLPTAPRANRNVSKQQGAWWLDINKDD